MISINDLTFAYKKGEPVLSGLDLDLQQGKIYGLLGLNGAGKTTTIRTLLGLYIVPINTINIFGKDIQKERIAILKNIGSLVETPSLYEHLTAYENLNILRNYLGGKKERIKEVLEIVDLSHAIKKKVKAMSLGMKQRLALAIALFNEPQLLILDEPTNGLDPQGIREVRELLIKLNNEKGITIFISSHILSEVEKLATDVGVINKGKLVFEGKMTELKRASQNRILIETDSNQKTIELLTSIETEPRAINEKTISIILGENKTLNKPLKKLIENNVQILSVKSDSGNIEELFFELTGRKR